MSTEPDSKRSVFAWGQSLRRLVRHEQFILSGMAFLVGLLGGVAAILFRDGIALSQTFFYGYGGERLHSFAEQLDWWHILFAPALGGLLVGAMVHRLMPDKRPQSVAEVIESSALQGARMRLGTGLGAVLISAVTLGSGASAGREGPVVHFSAVLTTFVAQRLHLGRAQRKTLLACGVASGVAASFNAPFAGIFFALEVVIGSYAMSTFTPVVISAVCGTLLSRAYYGDVTAFIIPHHKIVSFLEFPAFAILGVVSAIVAISFIWAVGVVEKVLPLIHVPSWLRPCVGGLGVGAIALVFPQVLGVGYEATDQALNEEYALYFLILLIVAKTTATAVTLGSGFGGGVFSPSLFLGAMLGGAFGIVATSLFPHLSSGHGAYTIVGMGAVAGAVLGAPISTILMVFELTGDYALTVAVMIATVIASQIVIQGYGHSFFSKQLAKRGINLSAGRERGILRARRIPSVMRHDFVFVSPDATMKEVRQKLQLCFYGEVFVVNEDKTLVGTITLHDLSDAAFDPSHDEGLRAVSVARLNPPVVAVSDDLETAMSLMESSGEEHIAVVDSKESGKLVGVLHERHVMAAYHYAVLETRTAERD